MLAKINKSGKKYIVITFLMLLFQAALLLISSGSINNLRYLFFIALNMLYTIAAIVTLYKKNSKLLCERGEKKEDIKRWDLYLVLAHHIILILVLPIVIGFDFLNNGFYFNSFYLIPGLILYGLSNLLVLSSMIVNTHFEPNVRIQNDRNHKVISKWPYSFVRHPGYLGSILWSACVPFILGSIVGLIPSCMAIIIMIIRTYLEDKTLQDELFGYKTYTLKTKYRLFPKIF